MAPHRRNPSPDFGPKNRTGGSKMKDPTIIPFPELARARMVEFNPNLPPAAFPSLPFGPRPSIPEPQEQQRVATSTPASLPVASSEPEASAAVDDEQRGRKRKREDAPSNKQPEPADEMEVDDYGISSGSDIEGDQTKSHWETNAPGISALTKEELAQLATHGDGEITPAEGLSFSPSPEPETPGPAAIEPAAPDSTSSPLLAPEPDTKDHEISWSRIAPALQLEIFHNTRERLNEQKAVTLLGLDADDIKFIGKLVKEYQRQIEFEDDIRRKALAKQLEILMRADHTKPDEAMEATDALHDITEQQFAAVLQSDQVEFNVISSREMKTAHDFLEHKNLTIDLAGDWSSTYPGEWERSDEHPDNFLATFRAENLLRTVSNQKKARGVKGVTNVKDPAPARRPKPIKSSGRSLRSRASSEESTIIAEPKSSDNSTMPPPTSVKSRKPRSSQKIKPSPLKTELRHSVSPPAWDDSAQRIHQSTLLRSTPRRSLSGPTVRSRSSTVVSQDGLESGGLPRRLRSPSDLRPSRAKLEMQETGALLEGVRGLDPSSSRPHQSSSTPESSHDKHAKMVTFRLQSALLKDIEARHPAFTANSAVFTGLSTSITPHLSHGSSIISRSSMDPVQGSLQSLSLSNNISHQVGKALTNKLSDYKTSASDNEANHDVEIDYGRQQAMSGSGGSPSHSVVLPSIETDDYGHQNKTSTSPFYGTAHLLTPAATSPSKRGTLENDESEYSPSEGSNGHHEEGITGSQVRKSRKHPAGRLIAFKSTAAGKAVMESPKKGKNTGSTFSTKPDSTPTTPKKRQYKKKSAALQRRVPPEAAMAASIAADEARIRAEQQDDTTVTNANDNSGIGGEVQAEVHSQTPTSTAQTQPKPKARRGRPRTRPLPNTPATSATSNISSSAPSSASRNLSFSSSLVVGNTASATSIPSAPKARGTTATTATTPKTKTTRKYTKKETIATAPATSTGDVDGDADAEVITKKDANAKARISGGRKKTSASAGADTDAAAGSTAAGASGHSVVIGGGRNGKKK